jgi:hypothetical protein
MEATAGAPEGKLRTEGAKLTAFLTKDIGGQQQMVVVVVINILVQSNTLDSTPEPTGVSAIIILSQQLLIWFCLPDSPTPLHCSITIQFLYV